LSTKIDGVSRTEICSGGRLGRGRRGFNSVVQPGIGESDLPGQRPIGLIERHPCAFAGSRPLASATPGRMAMFTQWVIIREIRKGG